MRFGGSAEGGGLTFLNDVDALPEDLRGAGVWIDGSDQDDGLDALLIRRGNVARDDAAHAVADDDDILLDVECVEEAQGVGGDGGDAVAGPGVGREARAVGVEGQAGVAGGGEEGGYGGEVGGGGAEAVDEEEGEGGGGGGGGGSEGVEEGFGVDGEEGHDDVGDGG